MFKGIAGAAFAGGIAATAARAEGGTKLSSFLAFADAHKRPATVAEQVS